jgi:methyltransferase (TIGR00027 family)
LADQDAPNTQPRERSPSRTAAYVALFRALETRLPDDKRLFSDPFADAFLDARLGAALAAAKVPVTGGVVTQVIDRSWPGTMASVIVRTRYIDEVLEAAIEDGIEQVVVLGAGFDARAYRLEAAARARVFEVDERPTQAAKRERIVRRLGHEPANVTWVAVDFERDDLAEALRGAGLDPEARAIFIWEGVAVYLTPEAVDETLRAVTSVGAPGSRIVFTYLDRRVLDGKIKPPPGAEATMNRVSRAGEPFRFGLEPDEVAGWLADRGLELVHEVSTVKLAERYLHPRGRRPPTSPLFRLALATY